MPYPGVESDEWFHDLRLSDMPAFIPTTVSWQTAFLHRLFFGETGAGDHA